MRRRRQPAEHDKLYVLPFLVVCVLFVRHGMGFLLPGTFGMVWTLLASGVTLYAWVALLKKPSLSWKAAPPLVDGTADRTDAGKALETGDGENGGASPLWSDDPLIAEVNRILGLEGVLEAALAADGEQRERLEELKALYELHSLSEEEYQRQFREILEEKRA